MTFEQAIQLIDFEIAQLEAKEQRFGLSVWVLVAAIASMLWVAIGIVRDAPTVWAPPALFLIVMMLLVAHALSFVTLFVLWYPRKQEADEVRFRSPHMMASQRVEIFSGGVLSALVVAVLTLSPFVPLSPIHWWWTVSVFSVLATIVVLGFVGSFRDTPVEIVPPAKWMTGGYRIFVAGIAIAVIAPCLFALFGVSDHQESFTWDDWRVAYLVTGAAVLLSVLLSRTSHRLSIEALIAIRRDLSYGRTEPDVAVRHVEIALSGVPLTGRLGDVTSPILREVRAIIEESAVLTREMQTQAQELENSREGAIIDMEKVRAGAKRRSEYFERKKERATYLIDEFRRARKRLRLLRVSTRARAAVDETGRLLTTELLRLVEDSKEFGEAIDRLYAAVKKAKGEAPVAAELKTVVEAPTSTPLEAIDDSHEAVAAAHDDPATSPAPMLIDDDGPI
jgi:hypothetical protein